MQGISDAVYNDLGQALTVEPASIKAVFEVESSGRGFMTVLGEERPIIRPEAHWFSAKTKRQYDSTHPHISSREWNPSLAARNQVEAWQQFDEMASLDRNAAIEATSWGAPQVMGFHWKAFGYDSPEAFYQQALTPEGQLNLFLAFVRTTPGCLDALRNKDWSTFARIYNGPGQVPVYSARMAEAYARHAK